MRTKAQMEKTTTTSRTPLAERRVANELTQAQAVI
jgi:hypothetical protein